MLIEHQAAQPEGYPYVFVTPKRYDYIQKLRRLGRWTIRSTINGQQPSEFLRKLGQVHSMTLNCPACRK